MTDILDKLTWEFQRWLHLNGIKAPGITITITMPSNMAKNRVVNQLYQDNTSLDPLGHDTYERFGTYNNIKINIKSQEDWASFH